MQETIQKMKYLFFLIAAILPATLIWGQDLRVEVSGNASFNNSQYVITEAGEDFPTSIESETSLYVSVRYNTNFWGYLFYPDKKWRIFIHKSDLNWDSDLILSAKRTGTGSIINNWWAQPLYITGGSNFQNINNTPDFFFRGRHGIVNIPINFKLTGASLTMGAETFETNIIFTVYDEW